MTLAEAITEVSADPKLDSMEMSEIISNATIHVNDVQDIALDDLNTILQEYTFAIVKGLVSPQTVIDARKKIDQQFDSSKDRPATGEAPDEIMNNFQKLSLGGAEHSGVYRPRCMRTFYNPIWAEDIYGLRDAFRVQAQLRNILYGFPIDYAIESVDSGFWTAARVHHYPAGGGFLVSHLDNIVPQVQQKSGLTNQYFQPVLMMSKKGTTPDCDYSRGGGFFGVGNRRFFYETECELGDIIIYSGRTVHGVADIDLQEPFNSTSPKGRYAGFVTLYKHFERKAELGDYVEMSKDRISD